MKSYQSRQPVLSVQTVGRLPWKKHDVVRRFEDGHTELLRWAILDANNQEVAIDFSSEEARDRAVAAVNLHRSAADTQISPKEAYLDPMSILRDAREILATVLEDREELYGRDPILRDLVRRVRKATTVAASGAKS